MATPDELRRRSDRKEKLEQAKAEIERRLEIAASLERKQTTPAAGKPRSALDDENPKPPPPTLTGKEHLNFTDPESRIMPTQGGKQFEQAYNCQAAVDAIGGSRPIVGACVTQHSNDKQELVPTLQSIPQALGRPEAVSADSRYFTSEAVVQVEKTEDGQATGITVYAAVERQQHGRTVEQLEARAQPTPPLAGAPMSVVLRYRLQTSTGKAIDKLRRETVEPIFGIIKEVLGFRRFRLRGIEKAKLEWKLVSLEYNLKRLHTLTAH